jgi:hypothetical protein
MTPRSRASEAALKKKRNAFEEVRVCTHRPHEPKLFPKTPGTYGKELPTFNPIKQPTLTEIGLKLAGF